MIRLRSAGYNYVVISMALVLLLTGCLVAGWLHLKDMISGLREQVTMLVELHDDVDRVSVISLREQLKQYPGLQSNTVKFVSKDEALKQMQDDLGNDFLDTLLQNPLRDAFSMYLKPAYLEDDSIAILKHRIRADSIVADVYVQVPGFDNIEQNANSLALISGGLIILFLLITIVLIHNTNRLALYANRFTIKNMELVGASWNFISWPYIRLLLT
jgi:cell division transport system permease protein